MNVDELNDDNVHKISALIGHMLTVCKYSSTGEAVTGQRQIELWSAHQACTAQKSACLLEALKAAVYDLLRDDRRFA